MITVLLVLQAFVTLALIGVVLIQRSEGGGLGLGTSQGMGNFMTGRGTANLLTRATAVLATLFMVLSLVLALLYKNGTGGSAESILNAPPPATQPSKTAPAKTSTPGPKPAKPAADLPAIPGESTPQAPTQSSARVTPTAPATPEPSSSSSTAMPAPKAPAAPATTKH